MKIGSAKLPLVSIVVLTCNRKSMVVELLHDFYRQTIIDDVEIVVVDNGSNDGTAKFIAEEFPSVILVANPENLGCAGRNRGILKASSDIIVTLDDDVFFHRANELERIIKYLSNNCDIEVVNFKILFSYNKKLIPFNWFHPRDPEIYQDLDFETDYISEGAVAFRKEVFSRVGYYSEDFFISHEGPDLALRIISAGMTIRYNGDVEVLHKCSLQQRSTWRNTYYDTRNYFWFLYRYWPIGHFVMKSIFRLVTSFVFSVSRGQLLWYFRAVRDAFIGLPRQRNYRQPLRRETRNRLREIHKFRPGFLLRVINYFRKIRTQNEQY